MTSPAPESERSAPVTGAWTVVGLLWIVALLNYLDRVMIMTMRESLTAAIPMTNEQFALLSTVFLWVYGLASPLMGYLADRYSRRRVIVGSMFIWSAVTWWTGHARSYEELLLTRALMGLSEACYIPAALALISEYHRGPTRALATGIHLSGLNLGAALGCLGGIFAAEFEWSFPFRLFGAVGIVYSLVLVALLRNPPTRAVESAPSRTGLRDALRTPDARRSFLLLMCIWSLIGMAGWPVHKWSPSYLRERFGLSEAMAGVWATLGFQVGCFFGMFVGGRISDIWTRTNPRARLLVPMFGLLVASPALSLHAEGPTFFFVIAGLVAFGFTRVFTDANMMPIVCELIDSRYRATAYGVLNAVSCIAGGCAILVGGWLRDNQAPVTHVFLGSAAGLLLCAVLLTRVRFPKGPNP